MRFLNAPLALIVVAGLYGQADDGFPELLPEHRGSIDYNPTVEHTLEVRGYVLTKESLVRGLRDSNAQVRSMAAGELAKMGEKQAIRLITEALSSEKAVGTRVWMANALAKLGGEEGAAELQALCQSGGLSDYVRLTAASFLFDLGDPACRDQAIGIVQTMSHRGSELRPTEIIYGLSVILRAASWFQPRAAEIRELATALLRDGRYEVRTSASNALGEFGDATSVQELQTAAVAETDKSARNRMLDNIKALKDKGYAPGTYQK